MVSVLDKQGKCQRLQGIFDQSREFGACVGMGRHATVFKHLGDTTTLGEESMQSTVTKSELIEHISESLKLPTGKAEQIVNCVFDSMVKALQNGEGIEIRGFGSFTVRDYEPYKGRNPRTGETVDVPAKKLPFFKAGKDLRERVNQSRQTEEAPASAAPGSPSALLGQNDGGSGSNF